MLPCLLTPSIPPPPSLLLADDTASYFSEKIEAVKKEFPQRSHDHIHPPTCICASPLLLLWMNHLCSELRPAPLSAQDPPPCSFPKDTFCGSSPLYFFPSLCWIFHPHKIYHCYSHLLKTSFLILLPLPATVHFFPSFYSAAS